jgi:hypothetical protein
LRLLHAALALVATAFVVLIVRANLDCAPKYFQRGDVIALLSLGVVYAFVLSWAALGDTDTRRAIGATGSAGLTALLISTASLPLLAAPIAIVGIFRLPRSGETRRRLLLALPAMVLVTFGLIYLGQLGMTSDQFVCT